MGEAANDTKHKALTRSPGTRAGREPDARTRGRLRPSARPRGYCVRVMATRFAGCQYGPLHLRKLLAARFEPGEHLVGWAVVSTDPRLHELLVWIAFMFLPGIGHAAAHAMTGGLRRVIVLTDRRMLVLTTAKKGADPRGTGVLAELALHEIELKRRGPGAYDLRIPGEARRLQAKLSLKAEGGIGRLARALEAWDAA